MINFLRNERRVYPEFDNANEQRLFTEELNFWGIKDERVEERRLEAKFSKEIVEMFKLEPGEEIDFTDKNEVNTNVRQTWGMLGPLRLLDIYKQSIDEINFETPYGKSMDKHRTQLYGQINPETGLCDGICR